MSTARVLLNWIHVNDYSIVVGCFSLMNDGYILLIPCYTDMSCVCVVGVDWQLTCL